VDEVAVAAVIEVERVDAVAIHLPVTLLDEAAAFPAPDLQVAGGQEAVEDEEAVGREAASVLGRDAGGPGRRPRRRPVALAPHPRRVARALASVASPR
jgi:hypothetical protein